MQTSLIFFVDAIFGDRLRAGRKTLNFAMGVRIPLSEPIFLIIIKMKKITKIEKELIKLAGECSGTIKIDSSSRTTYTAEDLVYKHIFTKYISNIPFSGNFIYYTLTNTGWQYYNSNLKK